VCDGLWPSKLAANMGMCANTGVHANMGVHAWLKLYFNVCALIFYVWRIKPIYSQTIFDTHGKIKLAIAKDLKNFTFLPGKFVDGVAGGWALDVNGLSLYGLDHRNSSNKRWTWNKTKQNKTFQTQILENRKENQGESSIFLLLIFLLHKI